MAGTRSIATSAPAAAATLSHRDGFGRARPTSGDALKLRLAKISGVVGADQGEETHRADRLGGQGLTHGIEE